jgi:nucleoid-associated protein YgaU
VPRIALYLILVALLFGGGTWLWLSQQQPAGRTTTQPVAEKASPPAPPNEPASAAVPTNPSFDVVRVAPDGRTVMAGRAAPGAEVTVKSGEDTVGSVTADKRGEWVLLPERPLEPGTRELSLSSAGDGGARDADATVVMVVPERAGAPSPLAVLLPKEGDGSRVLQPPAPQGDMSAVRGLTVDAIDFDAKGNIRPSGKAQPGTELRIYLDNRLVGTIAADERGHWSLRPTEPVAAGQHALRVDQLGRDGQTTARIEVPFNRTMPSLANARPGQITVQSGNSLWRIARKTYGSGDRFTVIYQANRELIRDPNKIYPGQIFAVPQR